MSDPKSRRGVEGPSRGGRASGFSFFYGSHRPRAFSAHKGLQCWLLTEPFPFVSVSVSLSISVSGSLLFPNILPEPLGSRAGGPGSGNRTVSRSHQGQ